MFEQVIKSRIVPIYNLMTCHRTQPNDNGNENGILLNANNIVECNESDYNGPPFIFEETSSFQILEGEMGVIKELVTVLKQNGISNDKIVIICPYNKYLTDINKMCQDIYNDMNRSVRDQNGILYRLDDRVMMTQNNYKHKLMNGDEGRITDLTNQHIIVTFKNEETSTFLLNYDSNTTQSFDLDESTDKSDELNTGMLIHSFAVSIHRYQGSESDYVIIYFPKSSGGRFLNRNLLYTAITRGKKIVWMVGDYDTMINAATTAPPYRCDNLAERLTN